MPTFGNTRPIDHMRLQRSTASDLCHGCHENDSLAGLLDAAPRPDNTRLAAHGAADGYVAQLVKPALIMLVSVFESTHSHHVIQPAQLAA